MRKYVWVLLMCLLLYLGLFSGCSNDDAPTPDISVPSTADGFDLLGGEWFVAGLIYENKVIDINDVDALADLYDTEWLSFRNDGTVLYHRLTIQEGKYTPYANQPSSFLLKFDKPETLQEIGATDDSANSDSSNETILIELVDQTTLIVSVFDPVTGMAKATDMPKIFALEGTESSYIADNKTPLNN